MRFFLDSSFPLSAVGPMRGGHYAERFVDSAVTDVELLNLARDGGFDCVVFVGRRASAEPSIRSAIHRHSHLKVAFTTADHPEDAADAVHVNAPRLASALQTSSSRTFLIRPQSVEVLDLDTED